MPDAIRFLERDWAPKTGYRIGDKAVIVSINEDSNITE